jgi:UDP-glucose 4-epimerase
MSSVDVLGVFDGGHAPDYLPLDDDHPCRPSSRVQADLLRW